MSNTLRKIISINCYKDHEEVMKNDIKIYSNYKERCKKKDGRRVRET